MRDSILSPEQDGHQRPWAGLFAAMCGTITGNLVAFAAAGAFTLRLTHSFDMAAGVCVAMAILTVPICALFLWHIKSHQNPVPWTSMPRIFLSSLIQGAFVWAMICIVLIDALLGEAIRRRRNEWKTMFDELRSHEGLSGLRHVHG